MEVKLLFNPVLRAWGYSPRSNRKSRGREVLRAGGGGVVGWWGGWWGCVLLTRAKEMGLPAGPGMTAGDKPSLNTRNDAPEHVRSGHSIP